MQLVAEWSTQSNDSWMISVNQENHSFLLRIILNHPHSLRLIKVFVELYYLSLLIRFGLRRPIRIVTSPVLIDLKAAIASWCDNPCNAVPFTDRISSPEIEINGNAIKLRPTKIKQSSALAHLLLGCPSPLPVHSDRLSSRRSQSHPLASPCRPQWRIRVPWRRFLWGISPDVSWNHFRLGAACRTYSPPRRLRRQTLLRSRWPTSFRLRWSWSEMERMEWGKQVSRLCFFGVLKGEQCDNGNCYCKYKTMDKWTVNYGSLPWESVRHEPQLHHHHQRLIIIIL